MIPVENMKPLFNNVIVLPDPIKTTTEGGLQLISPASEANANYGTVMEVGPGVVEDGVLRPVTIKKGDRVFFKTWGYDEIKISDKVYYIFPDTTVLMTFTE